MNEYLDSILDDNEKNALIAFNQSDVMREAVKKVLLVAIYRNGKLRQGEPADALKNAAFALVSSSRSFTDEEIGQDLKALWQGVNAIEFGFDELQKFVLPPEKVDKSENPAR